MTLGKGVADGCEIRKGREGKEREREATRPDSAHLVEQPQHLWHIELHILEVQHGLIIFLLKASGSARVHTWGTVPPVPALGLALGLTFSSKSSIFRSISRMGFSRPLKWSAMMNVPGVGEVMLK